MNVAFFLTPKQQVVWVPAQATVLEALERMEAHRYSAVPLLDAEGHYVGTITEGDLLWLLQRTALPWREVAAATPLLAAPRRMDNQPVRIDAEIEALIARAMDQGFVPVIDDRDVFVGIVRRRRIIEYCVEHAGLLPALGKPKVS